MYHFGVGAHLERSVNILMFYLCSDKSIDFSTMLDESSIFDNDVNEDFLAKLDDDSPKILKDKKLSKYYRYPVTSHTSASALISYKPSAGDALFAGCKRYGRIF